MTELDDAMEQYMANLVLSEGRPFSFKDFLRFEWDGKEYTPNYGTIRNKFSAFTEKGVIELDYKTNIAFYTLKDRRFGKKPMTPYPAGVSISHNHPVYKLLESLVLDKQSFHNIHLMFEVPNIYKIFSVNTDFPRIQRSEQVVIPSWKKNNTIVRIVISKTDTVSVTIGCSLEPIPLDSNGIIRLFTTLARLEERLQIVLDNSTVDHGKPNQSIPEYGKWVITQWHFNRDALQEYDGEKFNITVGNAEHMLARIYTKNFGKHMKARLEIQEYPNKTVFDAIEEKLN